MKIKYNIHNLQDSRIVFEQSPVKNFLQSLYHKARACVGNWWGVYLHWKLHYSNIFQQHSHTLGVFDGVSMHIWSLEYDFSKIYVNCDYNRKYIHRVLSNYVYKIDLDYKKMFIYAMLHIRERIKSSYIDEVSRNYYRYDLLKIQQELWNLT